MRVYIEHTGIWSKGVLLILSPANGRPCLTQHGSLESWLAQVFLLSLQASSSKQIEPRQGHSLLQPPVIWQNIQWILQGAGSWAASSFFHAISPQPSYFHFQFEEMLLLVLVLIMGSLLHIISFIILSLLRIWNILSVIFIWREGRIFSWVHSVLWWEVTL